MGETNGREDASGSSSDDLLVSSRLVRSRERKGMEGKAYVRN